MNYNERVEQILDQLANGDARLTERYAEHVSHNCDTDLVAGVAFVFMRLEQAGKWQDLLAMAASVSPHCEVDLVNFKAQIDNRWERKQFAEEEASSEQRENDRAAQEAAA